MPGLKLFRRRWHLATDTLPLLTILLCIFHVVWFIPYATGRYSIETTGLLYQCPQGSALRVANYSLFILFALSALNEAAISVLGLRGGPFQTRKRRFVNPLLYVEVALWALLLGFTVYATVLVYSNAINAGCWSNNPCQFQETMPLGCTDKNGNNRTELSPACQAILENGAWFLESCWTDWLAYAANWAVSMDNFVTETTEAIWAEYLNGTLAPLNATLPEEARQELRQQIVDVFNEEFRNGTGFAAEDYEDGPFPLCNKTIDAPLWERQLGIELHINDSVSDGGGWMLMFGDVDSIEEYNAFLHEHPNLFLYVNSLILQAIQEGTGLDLLFGGDLSLNFTRSTDVPWTSCFNGSRCEELFLAADECDSWAALLALPKPKTMRTFFETLVIATWVELFITGLICFLVFNAFPDYNDVDSWEGSVKSMGRMCCFGGALAGSAAVGGNDLTVSHEIAKSLNLLFGGIDLDPSDRLLGIYLVSERQHRRRQQDVLRALQDAGYIAGRQRSRMHSTLQRLRLRKGDTRSVSDTTSAGLTHSGPATLQPSPHARSSTPAGTAEAGSCSAATAAAAAAAAGAAAAKGASLNRGSLQRGSRGSGGEDGAEAPQAVPLAPSPAAAAGQPASPAKLLPSPFASASGSSQLPASPFQSAPAAAGVRPAAPQPAQAQQGRALPRLTNLMVYKHSMLRLRSSLHQGSSGGADGDEQLSAVEQGHSGVEGRGTSASLAALQDLTGASAGAPAAPAAASSGRQLSVCEDEEELEQEGEEQEVAEEALELVPASASAAGASAAGGPLRAGIALKPSAGSWPHAAIRVTSRYQPLLTPSGCAGGEHLDPPISPQAAADIYAGKLDPVDSQTLREAQSNSRFAVAAYGLQSVIWAKGKRPAMCLKNANRLVRCLKRPFKLEDRFRKQNFDAIVQITGIQPADLLYVSYTNVAGGVLPYIIMLHRPSKSVVLSVRGTVSMEDLITDLLSNPVDVSDWVPEWVATEASRRRAEGMAGDASGTSLKAHIGIVSSATAILADMDKRGLLREMLLSKMLRAASLVGQDTQRVMEEFIRSQPSWELPHVPATQQPSMQRRAAAAAAAGSSGSSRGTAAVEAEQAGVRPAPNGCRSDSTWGAFKEEAVEEDETERAQFAEQEARHLQRLGSLREDREVDLPLERAQTIIRSKLQLRGWKFVVTGHSLGAAVASLLGMQLRDRFPDLQCWAYNPPGGLVSWELSQIAQSYCTSVVVGKDIISRLSFNTSKRVVDEMVVCLARCIRPKLKVLAEVALGRRKRADAAGPRSFCSFADISPEALQLVESYYRASALHLASADTTEMYPPGKLVFLRPFKGKKKGQTVWDAVWIDAATLISEGILVTPTMMAHHRLYVLADAFQSIFANEAATQAAPQQAQGEEDIIGT